MTRDEYKALMRQELNQMIVFDPSHAQRAAAEYQSKQYSASQLMEQVELGTELGDKVLTQFIAFKETGKLLRPPGETSTWIEYDETDSTLN